MGGDRRPGGGAGCITAMDCGPPKGRSMNLVNELQVSAEREDVLVVLRKARRLASKLGVNDIDEWLRAEQDGYDTSQTIPKYRMVKGALVFNTNGPVPVGMGMAANGVMDYPGGIALDTPMAFSMSEIVGLIDGARSRKNAIYMTIHQPEILRDLHDTLHPILANRVTFMLRMSPAQIRAIPEAVKDKVLDWACELERRGVHGENMTFSGEERAAAHAITFNISGSRIEQLNNMGDNYKR
jgi:hypothetical protein